MTILSFATLCGSQGGSIASRVRFFFSLAVFGLPIGCAPGPSSSSSDTPDFEGLHSSTSFCCSTFYSVSSRKYFSLFCFCESGMGPHRAPAGKFKGRPGVNDRDTSPSHRPSRYKADAVTCRAVLAATNYSRAPRRPRNAARDSPVQTTGICAESSLAARLRR